MEHKLVQDIMENYYYKAMDTSSCNEILAMMEDEKLTYLPVVNQSNIYVGIVFMETNVSFPVTDSSLDCQIISDVKKLKKQTPLSDITLSDFTIPYLPVVDERCLIGIVSKDQYVNFLIQKEREKTVKLQQTLSEVIEETKEMEEEYRELEAAMEHSYDGIAIADSSGVTVKVNKAWVRLTGLKKEEVIGVSLRELVDKGYFSDSVTMKVMQSRKPKTIMQKMKSGKRAMMTGSPIFDEKGKLTKVIINIRDITQLYQLQENLEAKEKIATSYQTEINQIRLKQNAEEGIVAESKEMQELLTTASQVARVKTTILLTGESGVGKGVVARYIHKCSRDEDGENHPFITVNCGAIPEHLLESELFGYVGGAFTGAQQRGKVGMFELADNGTIFLDEIGDLPLNLQVKLLHVLQEKTITKVGGTKPIELDVRIIAATNKDLTRLVKEGKFREDLFYRLNVVPLTIPPLRRRKDDILPLSVHYLNIYNKKYALNKTFSNELIDLLLEYEWLGNIRELANVIERMAVTTSSDVLTRTCFPIKNIVPTESADFIPHMSKDELPTLEDANNALESNLIKEALKIGKTQHEAAKLLGVSLSTFVRKMKKLNVT